MYTLSTCPWCKKTKNWFNDRNIHFDYIDYDDLDSEQKKPVREKIQKDNLNLSFPIVYIDDIIIQGYNPDKFEKAMADKQKG
jgi:glutaredoxin